MLKIYSWNVNGIRAVKRKKLFDPFIKEHDPDILCLQETKAKPGQIEVDLPEYEEFYNSAERAGYSGTAIFSKQAPMNTAVGFPKELSDKYDMSGDGYGDPNTEGRVSTAEFDDFYLVTVYTPNAKGDLSRIPLRYEHWDPAFLEYVKGLEAGAIRLDAGSDLPVSTSDSSGSKKPVIFCGDLNVAHTEDDLARPKENEGKKGFTKEEREGFQSFIDAGFVDTFRMFHEGNGHYTWWTHWANARERNVGWRIDYVLVSESLKPKVKAADIHPDVMGSDHCPVSVKIDLPNK